MIDVKVTTPKGRVGTIHNIKAGEDWRDRYQWIWGIWPEDSVLIEATQTPDQREEL